MQTELEIQKAQTDVALMESWKALLACDYYPTSVVIKKLILQHKEASKNPETPEHLIPLHQNEITRLQSILYPPQTLAS